MFSRKSGLVPGFTTILKCTSECDGIVALHTYRKAPSVRKRPEGSFMLGTSALCSEHQMILFMA